VALQPGREYVLGDLLEFEDEYQGAEFYMAPLDDSLAGGRQLPVHGVSLNCLGFLYAVAASRGRPLLEPCRLMGLGVGA
jgi:hypothetical protein